MHDDLPENVYPISYLPTKAQANNKGNVLWYAKGLGWYIGWFQHPYMKETSHWTYAPDDLNIEPEPADVIDKAFDTWVSQYPESCFDSVSSALLKLGYMGGWKRGQS